MNPAKNRTFGGGLNHSILFPREFAEQIFQSASHESWIARVRTASGSDPIKAQLECMIPSLPLRVLTRPQAGGACFVGEEKGIE